SVYEDLEDMYEEIRQGEVMKRVILRLYISAKTLNGLEERVQEVIENIESLNFRGSVLLNEQEYEWKSLFSNYQSQQYYPNRRKGFGVPSMTLAAGMPFHFTSLSDPNGRYYGSTDTGGNVIFDLFHNDS